jgi:ABC-type multidrug transport system fused ATPase/permease subunit
VRFIFGNFARMSEKKSLNFLVFKRLLANTKPYKRILFLSVACTILLSFLGPLRPLLIGQMVDRFLVQSKQPDMLVIWTFMIIGLLIIESLLQFAGMYFSNLLAQSVIRDLRTRIFGHLLRFRMQYFDKTPIGSLVTRVVSDLEAITEVFSSGILEIAGDRSFVDVLDQLAINPNDFGSNSIFTHRDAYFCSCHAEVLSVGANSSKQTEHLRTRTP